MDESKQCETRCTVHGGACALAENTDHYHWHRTPSQNDRECDWITSREDLAVHLNKRLDAMAAAFTSIQDLAEARLRNPPLSPMVEHDLREIARIASGALKGAPGATPLQPEGSERRMETAHAFMWRLGMCTADAADPPGCHGTACTELVAREVGLRALVERIEREAMDLSHSAPDFAGRILGLAHRVLGRPDTPATT